MFKHSAPRVSGYVLALGIIAATSAALYAQSVSGTILGTVTDSSGAVISNA